MGDAVNLAARLMAQAPRRRALRDAPACWSAPRRASTPSRWSRSRSRASARRSRLVGRARRSAAARASGVAVALPAGRPRRASSRRSATRSTTRARGARPPGRARRRARHGQDAADGGAARPRRRHVACCTSPASRTPSATPYSPGASCCASCSASPGRTPTRSSSSACATAVRELDPELEPWLPLLAIAFGVDVPPTPEVAELAPEFRRARLHEVVLRFLRAPAPGPDADRGRGRAPDGRGVGGAAAARSPPSSPMLPWLVVVARRDAAAASSRPRATHVLHARAAPLAARGSLALAEAVTEAAPLPPHALALAVERSGGNPQFLRDLLRAAGAGEDDAARTRSRPRRWRASTGSRPAERTLVRRAAVLGVELPPAPPRRRARPGRRRRTRTTWDRLSDFFEDDGDGYLRFRRAVVRDAAYAGLPFASGAGCTPRSPARLETRARRDADELAPVLSLHYARAGDHAKAWHYARLAADRARERLAFADAAALYRRALEAARQLGIPRDELADGLGVARGRLVHTGELASAHAGAHAPRAAWSRDDPVRTAQLLSRTRASPTAPGHVLARCAGRAAALRTLDGARRPRGCGAAARRRSSTLAAVRQRQGRIDEASRCASGDRGRRGARRRGAGRARARLPHPRLGALRCRAARRGAHSEPARSRSTGASATSTASRRCSTTWAASRTGRAAGTRRSRSTSAADASKRAGDVANAAFGDCNVGEVPRDQGRLEEAEPPAPGAAGLARARSDEWGDGVRDDAARPRRGARRPPRRGARRCSRRGSTQFRRAARAGRRGARPRPTSRRRSPSPAVRSAALLRGRPRAARRRRVRAPLLHRVRGFALAQLGDDDGAAGDALHAPLREAEERANYLRGRRHPTTRSPRCGGAPAGSAARRAALLEQLGVEALPDTAGQPRIPGSPAGSSTVTTPSPLDRSSAALLYARRSDAAVGQQPLIDGLGGRRRAQRR